VPRLTKIYTRTGDRGETRLGSGEHVPKNHARIVAYGTVNELDALLGVVLATRPAAELVEPLRRIQNELFHAGAELCLSPAAREKTPGPRIAARHVTALERLIDGLNAKLEPLKNFVLPGGNPAAAFLHAACTFCRRAEREIISLAQQEPVGEHVIAYMNRLSDALFVMARYENRMSGVEETLWDSHA